MENCKIKLEKNLQKMPLIAILRGIRKEEVEPICNLFRDNGILLFEIPLNTPDALECIAIANQCADGDQMVGAGTVLTVEDVKNVKEAGGKFIISPNTDPAVIRATKEAGLLSIPGCFTATEAFTAQAAGADYLKLFPAGSIGPAYIKDLKAVVKLPFLAVGGVHLGNIAAFLQHSAGVGIGSALYKPGKSWDDLARDTALFAAAATEHAKP